ncbi:MAG: hypothetical protein U0791_09380 [Gemmataceae bacterium]
MNGDTTPALLVTGGGGTTNVLAISGTSAAWDIHGTVGPTPSFVSLDTNRSFVYSNLSSIVANVSGNGSNFLIVNPEANVTLNLGATSGNKINQLDNGNSKQIGVVIDQSGTSYSSADWTISGTDVTVNLDGGGVVSLLHIGVVTNKLTTLSAKGAAAGDDTFHVTAEATGGVKFTVDGGAGGSDTLDVIHSSGALSNTGSPNGTAWITGGYEDILYFGIELFEDNGV